MSRPMIVTDEQILARARTIFAERGYGARTRQIAAAVGVTWGAIATRFGSKRALFEQALAAAQPGTVSDDAGGVVDLPDLLGRLHEELAQCWPLRLQYRLASAAAVAGDTPDERVHRLAAAVEAQARRGTVRSDMGADALARLVLALLTGDVALRFMAREAAAPADRAFIDEVALLVSAGCAAYRRGSKWTDCDQ